MNEEILAAWKLVVHEAIKNNYFDIENDDNIICTARLCENCQFMKRECPVYGNRDSNYIDVRTHSDAIKDCFPEMFI